MAVFRIHKTDNYTVMSNAHLRDPRLTLKAKGLLSMVFSLPDDWKYSINGLAAICKEGPDAVSTAIRELEAVGYVIRTKRFPGETESGRIEYEYDFYEVPSEKQPPKKQPPEIQGVEIQGVENRHLLNKEDKGTDDQATEDKDDDDFSTKVKEIVGHLNEVCGTSYRPTTRQTRSRISARLGEGFTVEDFMAVIDSRKALWANDARMREYLRPETLFGTKFEGYLNAARSCAARQLDFSAYDL